MTVSTFDSVILGRLFGDPEVNRHLDDVAAVRAMVEVERALARAQAKLGVIPADAGPAISEALDAFVPDLSAIGLETVDSGVATIALVKQLRAKVGGEAAGFVHFGATSQDIIDTALVLRLVPIIEVLETRLQAVLGGLSSLAERHRKTAMVARTRYQQALPTSFGLKAAGWLSPLVRHRQRLGELRGRLLVVSFGGAGGTLASLAERGLAVETELASELGLGIPDGVWHTQRDNLAEFAGWLSLLTGSLGKMAQDVLLMAQNEVGELRETSIAGKGGSSTLPQKANPISSEVMVSAARFNAGMLSNMHQALIQEHERGGPGWQVEWMCLPQMIACAGGSLAHAAELAEQMSVQLPALGRNLNLSNGLLLAEAASFRLAEFMPRPQAQALVKAACNQSLETGQHLIDLLQSEVSHPVDWDGLRDPRNYLGATDALIDRAIRKASG